MKKILVFIGTRPEGIKLAPVVAALKNADCIVEVCLVSQHIEMLAQVLECFPVLNTDLNLNIMRGNQTLTETAAAVLTATQDVLRNAPTPDMVIVQGDTTTALFCALAATYAQIPVVHIEAGLRSGNRLSPYPEEVNRILISQCASTHFAPTVANAENLRRENISGDIHIVGNTVIDALLTTVEKIKNSSVIADTIKAAGYCPAPERKFILVTGHRRESFGEGLDNICKALKRIAESHPECDIVYAVHLNPKVRDSVFSLLADSPNIFLLPPLDYQCFVYLMSHCYLILTDSGGIQEEAPSLNKPVLVMRNDTERAEVVECGAALLTGTDTTNISDAAEQLLTDSALYQKMANAKNPFGDGNSAQRITEILLR